MLAGILKPWRTIYAERHLILSLARRDLASHYRESVLGLFWSLITPLIMLGVFYFVFTKIFQPRWETSNGGNFALILFAGMILFQFLSECLTRSPTVISGHASFVKKIVFPVETLPCAIVLTALANAVISLSVLLVGYVVIIGPPPVTLLLLPLVVAPFAVMSLGLSWLLAALGVYIPDIGQVIGVVTTVLMFLSGVFYPVDTLPVQWRAIVYLSPATLPIQQARDVIFWNRVPDPILWIVFLGLALVVAWVGLSVFSKLKAGFADVV